MVLVKSNARIGKERIDMKILLCEDGTGKVIRKHDEDLEVVVVCCGLPTPTSVTLNTKMCSLIQIPCSTCGKIYTFNVDDLFQLMPVRTEVIELPED